MATGTGSKKKASPLSLEQFISITAPLLDLEKVLFLLLFSVIIAIVTTMKSIITFKNWFVLRGFDFFFFLSCGFLGSWDFKLNRHWCVQEFGYCSKEGFYNPQLEVRRCPGYFLFIYSCSYNSSFVLNCHIICWFENGGKPLYFKNIKILDEVEFYVYVYLISLLLRFQEYQRNGASYVYSWFFLFSCAFFK